MRIDLLTGVLGVALTLSPLAVAQQRPENSSGSVARAVAFQRAKDRADARQARREQRHPSVTYSNADRAMDDSGDGHHVTDPGPAPKKKR